MSLNYLAALALLAANCSWAAVSTVAAGGEHSCAVEGDGTVWCWGANQWGQLGAPVGAPKPTPTLVASAFGGHDVTSVAAGHDHTCALTAAGEVWCWGRNEASQLGSVTPGNAPSAMPLKVAGLGSPVVAISAGGQHTCAVRGTGVVMCWGSNYLGQLGRSTLSPPQVAPGLVIGVTQAFAVSAGDSHTCAVRVGGQVMCWGENFDGQLGRGAFSDAQPTAALVTGLDDAADIAAGGTFSCALRIDGSLACWGANAAGQLGTGSTGASQPSPQPVADLDGSVKLQAGNRHACALRETGAIACWGAGDFGQIGNGGWTWSIPSPATIDIDAVHLATGFGHTCARKANTTVACWGDNGKGQLGTGLLPADQTAPQATGLTGVADLTAGAFHSCALEQNGSVACWGKNQYGELGLGVSGGARLTPQPLAGLADVLAVAAGYSHTCAIRDGGAVACWGYNYYHQLGTDSGGASLPAPTDIANFGDAVSLSGGGRHTCAAKLDGTVWCWGDNLYSQLGTDTSWEPSATPLQVAGLAGVLSVGAGNYHTCALKQNGTVWCWGRNGDGQLGMGSVSGPVLAPQQVGGLPGYVTALMAGANHTCAHVVASGQAQLWCWGAGGLGQLGNGINFEPQAVPLQAGSQLALVAAGSYGTCGKNAQGVVMCWGANTSGQLATGSFGNHYFPAVSGGFANRAVIAIGERHACGLSLPAGTVSCAGNAFFGQRGDGVIASSPVPAVAAGLGDDGIFADDFEL